MFDLRNPAHQRLLNSMTKYPSIPTFHELKKGLLDPCVQVDFKDQLVSVTEKVDGTNARIVYIPAPLSSDDHPKWVIGSRENLLTCSEDWFHSPELGIVAELTEVADDLLWHSGDELRVYFFEVYGGKLNANWKQYTKDPELRGHRLFDVIEFGHDELDSLVNHSDCEEIAAWRDRGGQPFVDWDRFLEIAQETNLERVPVIERRLDPAGEAFTDLQGTLEAMREWFPHGSQAVLDSTLQGRSEGVVFKSHDRKTTAKLRFEDYEKSVRRLKAAKRLEEEVE